VEEMLAGFDYGDPLACFVVFEADWTRGEVADDLRPSQITEVQRVDLVVSNDASPLHWGVVADEILVLNCVLPNKSLDQVDLLLNGPPAFSLEQILLEGDAWNEVDEAGVCFRNSKLASCAEPDLLVRSLHSNYLDKQCDEIQPKQN